MEIPKKTATDRSILHPFPLTGLCKHSRTSIFSFVFASTDDRRRRHGRRDDMRWIIVLSRLLSLGVYVLRANPEFQSRENSCGTSKHIKVIMLVGELGSSRLGPARGAHARTGDSQSASFRSTESGLERKPHPVGDLLGRSTSDP